MKKIILSLQIKLLNKIRTLIIKSIITKIKSEKKYFKY